VNDYLRDATVLVNKTWLDRTDDLKSMLGALETACVAMRQFVREVSNEPNIKAALAQSFQQKRQARDVVALSEAMDAFVHHERRALLKHGLPKTIVDDYIPRCRGRLAGAIQNFDPKTFEDDALAFQQTICAAAELGRTAQNRDNLFTKMKLAGEALLGAFTVTVNSTVVATTTVVLPALFPTVTLAVLSVPLGADIFSESRKNWPK
jgi:hypothetical protein